MKKLAPLLLAACLCGSLFAAGRNQNDGEKAGRRLETVPGVARAETLILENPQGRVEPADFFNRWAPEMRGASTGLQQLCLDSLWYIDPQEGLDGVWENALAAEKPIYNANFTLMTVKLKKGIYWSDGVEFTADDLIYTVDIQKKTPGMAYSERFQTYVDRVEKSDDYTAFFYFKTPNSRFHEFFTVRKSACYIMPKHIFETQPDPLAYNFNPPVGLGPYKLKTFDPRGDWYLWEKRDDWERTALAGLASLELSPKYALYIAAVPGGEEGASRKSDKADMGRDTADETIARARQNPDSRIWYPDFPWGYPAPSLPAVIFNVEKKGLDRRDVRWAMTLAIDISRVALASYRGMAAISAIAAPPSGQYPKRCFEPLEGWLKEFTLDLGGGETFAPYDPEASARIAAEARETLGDLAPDPAAPVVAAAAVEKLPGSGWWKRDLAAAEKLMLKAGMRRNAGNVWIFADGSPFRVSLLAEGDTNPAMNRAASAIAECWREFGIDAVLDVRDDASRARLGELGDFDAEFGRAVETWGGRPDMLFFLASWHSKLYRPNGEIAAGGNRMRWRHPQLDSVIDQLQKLDFDDPRIPGLGQEFLKLAAVEMPIIPIMSCSVFTTFDETYWTGFPTSEDPYTAPVSDWGNSRYIFARVRPKIEAAD